MMYGEGRGQALEQRSSSPAGTWGERLGRTGARPALLTKASRAAHGASSLYQGSLFVVFSSTADARGAAADGMSLQTGREAPLHPVYSPQFHCLDSRFFLPGFHSGWAGGFCLCPLGGPLYYDQQVWPAVQVRDERYVQSLSSSRRHLPGLPGPYSAHGKVLWLYSYVVDIGANLLKRILPRGCCSALFFCQESSGVIWAGGSLYALWLVQKCVHVY